MHVKLPCTHSEVSEKKNLSFTIKAWNLSAHRAHVRVMEFTLDSILFYQSDEIPENIGPLSGLLRGWFYGFPGNKSEHLSSMVNTE